MLWGWGWSAEESQAKGAVRLQKSVATLIYANVKYIKGVENILINIADSEELFSHSSHASQICNHPAKQEPTQKIYYGHLGKFQGGVLGYACIC